MVTDMQKRQSSALFDFFNPHRPRLKRLAVALAAAAFFSGAAMAADESRDLDMYQEAINLKSDLEHGKQLYRVCVVCHTPEGWGSKDGQYPQIAGQLKGVLIKQLEDIQSRNRDVPTMYPFATSKLLKSAQAVADISGYIANLPMTDDVGHGDGKDLEHGKKLYAEHCAECHGDGGEGDSEDLIPALHGQHYTYLVRQFEWIRDGKRRNGDKKMIKQAKTFSERDLKAVMDYTSRLPIPKEKLAEPGWQNPDFPAYKRGD